MRSRILVYYCLVLLGCGAAPAADLMPIAQQAIERACGNMSDAECVKVLAETICPDTDSVRECLQNLAGERP